MRHYGSVFPCTFKMAGINNLVSQQHTPEDLNPQQNCRRNQKSHKNLNY